MPRLLSLREWPAPCRRLREEFAEINAGLESEESTAAQSLQQAMVELLDGDEETTVRVRLVGGRVRVRLLVRHPEDSREDEDEALTDHGPPPLAPPPPSPFARPPPSPPSPPPPPPSPQQPSPPPPPRTLPARVAGSDGTLAIGSAEVVWEPKARTSASCPQQWQLSSVTSARAAEVQETTSRKVTRLTVRLRDLTLAWASCWLGRLLSSYRTPELPLPLSPLLQPLPPPPPPRPLLTPARDCSREGWSRTQSRAAADQSAAGQG